MCPRWVRVRQVDFWRPVVAIIITILNIIILFKSGGLAMMATLPELKPCAGLVPGLVPDSLYTFVFLG